MITLESTVQSILSSSWTIDIWWTDRVLFPERYVWAIRADNRIKSRKCLSNLVVWTFSRKSHACPSQELSLALLFGGTLYRHWQIILNLLFLEVDLGCKSFCLNSQLRIDSFPALVSVQPLTFEVYRYEVRGIMKITNQMRRIKKNLDVDLYTCLGQRYTHSPWPWISSKSEITISNLCTHGACLYFSLVLTVPSWHVPSVYNCKHDDSPSEPMPMLSRCFWSGKVFFGHVPGLTKEFRKWCHHLT